MRFSPNRIWKGRALGRFKKSKVAVENLQPLVQVSPINMIVAVAVPFSPPQHSPILGHLETKIEL